eukprot:16643-Heterococcus_DN1.PRE.1
MDVSSSSKAKATARNVNARQRNNFTAQTTLNSCRTSLHDGPTQASAEKRYAQLLHYTDTQQSQLILYHPMLLLMLLQCLAHHCNHHAAAAVVDDASVISLTYL